MKKYVTWQPYKWNLCSFQWIFFVNFAFFCSNFFYFEFSIFLGGKVLKFTFMTHLMMMSFFYFLGTFSKSWIFFWFHQFWKKSEFFKLKIAKKYKLKEGDGPLPPPSPIVPLTHRITLSLTPSQFLTHYLQYIIGRYYWKLAVRHTLHVKTGETGGNQNDSWKTQMLCASQG